ncbi:hypothetical protein T12_3730 [Trichinella patagoniensis]|uniref:Uncharacterized protein n=1 Tax=Trichinella patagoniensis TaxID=990121 RepID=A0A0V0Z7L9_9BILA|nr:hypothetical protein T12_3730 [Trichinella patagoniensis]
MKFSNRLKTYRSISRYKSPYSHGIIAHLRNGEWLSYLGSSNDDMQECDYIRAPFFVVTNKVTDHKRDIL